ncbi:MAG: cytochrome P460 family protein [Proteobacteria bacterium]|nr:cytochrome P460 family protein [Pseudomonadota bacterium]
MSFRSKLLSTTVLPIVVGVGVSMVAMNVNPPAQAASSFQVAQANPCNPCAAANPCNPCAANPCAPSAAVELTDSEAKDAYSCIKGSLRAGYAKSNLASGTGLKIAQDYQDWTRYSTRSYVSATHGGRFVQNYANSTAKAYGKYEDVGRLPAGSVVAKDSFAVRAGRVSAGPLFVMEKMPAGFNADSINWRYTLVMPDGKVIGTTNGKGSKNVEFCYGCHAAIAGEQSDSLFFLPEEYRVKF